MAAPAQPKKIVAPTVSQINAEFVTQVRLGEPGVCEGSARGLLGLSWGKRPSCPGKTDVKRKLPCGLG